jgi:hypothetical protein
MIIVLQEQSSSDTIVFSSVTSFDESYSGTVTSHPVEDSTTITDHFVTDNDKFKISGVVTDFDFLNPLKQIAYSVGGYEDNTVAKQSLIRFKNGELIGGTGVIPSNKTQNAIKNKLIQIHKLGQFVTVLMYQTPIDSSTPALIASKLNCLITNISFKEDAESGYAIYPEISLERVRLVSVKTESIGKGKIPSIQSLKDKVATQVAKGVADKCVDQVIHKDVDSLTESAVATTKPKVDKGTTVKLCKPTDADVDALRSLTRLEQMNVYLRDVTDLNLEMESVYRTLTNSALPATERELNLNKLSYLQKVKAYVTRGN